MLTVTAKFALLLHMTSFGTMTQVITKHRKEKLSVNVKIIAVGKIYKVSVSVNLYLNVKPLKSQLLYSIKPFLKEIQYILIASGERDIGQYAAAILSLMKKRSQVFLK